MKIFWVLTTLLLAQLAPQPQQTPTGSIEGIVVKAGSSEPISGADIELTRVDPVSVTPDPAMRPGAPGTPSPTISRATTSEDGKFVLTELPAGRYRLVATRAGGMFTPAEYGQRDPGGRGTTLLLSNGQKLSGLRLSMMPTGSITGRVVDGDDEPVPNARVLALEAVYRNGRRVLNTLQSVRTNDLGEYRLFWLRPGRYYVAVMRDDVRNFSFVVHVTAPDQFGSREDGSSPIVRSRTLDDGRIIEESSVLVYYGGETDEAKAQPIDVPPGTTVSAIDVSVREGTMRAHRVKGTVIGSNGQPAAGALVRLVPAQSAPHVIIPNMTADKQGGFNLGGVIPGPYFLVAMLNVGQGYSFNETFLDITNGTSSIIPIVVSDRDIENVSITLRPSFSLNGRVYVEGVANDVRWDITRTRVSLTRDPSFLGLPNASPITGGPRPGQRLNGAPAEDGSFTLAGFGQGGYRVNVNALPTTAYLKAIQLGSIDVLRNGMQIDNPPQTSLDILINLEGGTLQGIAMNDKSEPVVNATVVLVPDAPSRGSAHLYKVVSSDVTGRFEMKGIAPGTYKVFAWDSAPSGAWMEADFIRNFELAGKPVAFSDGSTQQVQVTVAPR